MINALDEKRNRKYSPGDIIYADSNYVRIYDCFGVVVEKNFWMEQVKTENVFNEELNEKIENGVLDKQVFFRVLGTKVFRQYWKANDDEEFEPNEKVVMHYICQSPVYVDSVNLKSIIELSKIDDGRVGESLFAGSNPYILEVLQDAEIIYDYLDGKRFGPSVKHVFYEDKLTRLLEQAIPIKI